MTTLVAQLLTKWRSFLLPVLLGGLIAGSLAWQVRGWQAASRIGIAHTAQARAEKELSDLRAAVANNVADLERLRAEEQTKAMNAAKAQTRRLLDLQAQLAESERERLKVSAQLQEELSHAAASDTRDLGPIVLRYLERVRAEQSSP